MNAQDYLKKAQKHEKEDNYKKAIRCYGKCIRLDPNHEKEYSGRVLLYFVTSYQKQSKARCVR